MGISAFVDGLSRLGQSRRARIVVPAALFVVMIVLRVAMAWSMPVRPLVPDRAEYEHLARNLLERGSYGFTPDWKQNPDMARSSWRMLYDSSGMMRCPGYPVLLAGLGSTVGPGHRVHQAFLAVVEGITVVVLYQLAKSLFGVLAGLAGGILYICNPAMVDNITKLGREPLLALFVVVGLSLVAIVARRKSITLAAMTGLWFGLGGYFKITVTVAGLLGVVWLVLLGWRRRQRRLLPAGLLMAFCAVLTWAPWLVRNSLAHGRRVGFTNLMGRAMYVGLVDPSWAERQPADFLERSDPLQAENGIEADRRFRMRFKAYAKEHPLGVLRRMIHNGPFFWSPVPRQVWSVGIRSKLEVAVAGYYLVCYVLAVVGLWANRRRAATWLVVLVLAGMTAAHSIGWACPRYRFPFEPVLLIVAGAGLAAWLGRWRSSATPAAGAGESAGGQ